jgi:hypothetical protein
MATKLCNRFKVFKYTVKQKFISEILPYIFLRIELRTIRGSGTIVIFSGTSTPWCQGALSITMTV